MSDSESPKKEVVYRGIAVSPGVVRGQVYVYRPQEVAIEKRSVRDDDIAGEFVRLEQAVIKTRQQLIEIPQHIGKEMGNDKPGIFDAHLLVLDDPMLMEQVFKRLKTEKLNVELILSEVANQYAQALAKLQDTYLRERAADVRDVSRRILRNLAGAEHDELQRLPGPRIVLAQDLSPSDTALMDRTKVLGFAAEMGSRTSHTAILARSQGIPAVVGLHEIGREIASGQEALLDGYTGLLIVNPSQETLYEYGQIEIRWHSIEDRLSSLRHEPACTRDGCAVRLGANIELVEEVKMAVEHGAQGVGLYRTEFLFINRQGFPTEDEQAAAYSNVARAMKPHEVIIRTLDAGGDKVLRVGEHSREANPFLGWRGIRFCLDQPEMFKTQLRAILRASAEGNIKMMYPMISDLQEVKRANELLNVCREDLRREGKPFNEQMEVGLMIEVPGAAIIADVLAEHAAFFSIGTNDLIQYSIAVDRGNERVAHLYAPTHPAILRLIRNVVAAARARNIWAGVCGEMAGDPVMAPLLLGLGVNELSVSAVAVPAVKYIIRSMSMPDAQALAEQALRCDTAGETAARLEDFARSVAPDLMELIRPSKSQT
ncbi:MAG: phosphoenolpyruvate--protein phosphotransferase [Verrucomicrobia bacterium GWF2_62_7]|nr:MAG: phosphoenolpyruvate--protein phosphotransferase [Verrucomicrobia bacterium GWF2_62_7]